MSDPAIASLIREVLAEELAKLGGSPVRAAQPERAEEVRIAGDEDLQAFARRVLALGRDPSTAAAIEAGSYRFHLGGRGATHAPSRRDLGPAMHSESAETVVIDRGFLSERQIDRMAKGTKRMKLGKAVRMTPLARDRARQRGIMIERMEQ